MFRTLTIISAPQVLDPFCGTGGLLLAAAAVGADPLASAGTDIDPAVRTWLLCNCFYCGQILLRVT